MLHSLNLGVYCLACGAQVPYPGLDDFAQYFAGELWGCGRCGHREELWDWYLKSIRSKSPFDAASALLGLGGRTIFAERVTRSSLIDLVEHGVPEDAAVLRINMTPVFDDDEDLTAIPAVGLQNMQTSHIPHRFTVHAVPTDSAPPSSAPPEVTVHFYVIWARPSEDPEREPLFTAAKSYSNGDYTAAVIPAQVAMELKIKQVLKNHYEQFDSGSVGLFLKDGSSYGYQLRFLMPSLFQFAGAPKLPEKVLTALRDLQKKRNSLGHATAPADRTEVARMLLGSLFGYQYLTAYGDLIAAKPSAGLEPSPST